MTRTIVGGDVDDQVEPTLQVSVSVEMHHSIELAQLTPTTKSHRSDKFSIGSSNSLQLSLSLNFDNSPTLSSCVLIN